MVQAVVSDAYGTLLDIHVAMQRYAARLGPAWQPISANWRGKQIGYTWMRSLAGAARRMAFVTSNPWDAFGAARFGCRVVWVNRADVPAEYDRHSYDLDSTATVLKDLAALPDALAGVPD